MGESDGRTDRYTREPHRCSRNPHRCSRKTAQMYPTNHIDATRGIGAVGWWRRCPQPEGRRVDRGKGGASHQQWVGAAKRLWRGGTTTSLRT
eukprot:jgi/Mesvir1/9268/Mv26136-RA.1